MKLHLLWSDILIWALVLCIAVFMLWKCRNPNWRRPWRQALSGGLSAAAAVVLMFYFAIGLLDSLHFQVISPAGNELKSALDLLVKPLGERTEATYSAPFADHLFTLTTIELGNGEQVRGYPPLMDNHHHASVMVRIIVGIGLGLSLGLMAFGIFLAIYCYNLPSSWRQSFKNIVLGRQFIAWRSIWATFTFMWMIIFTCGLLAVDNHILGTDKIGRDVFYLTIKSIRTGLIIGTITTVFMLPLALFLGTLAGYFRGWVDDVIQYCYTTLSSIPGVLLISASVLVLQVYMANHAENYPTLAQRADVRLLALCFILAMTGWADLCRFLRAETLKLRELEFVQAAKVLGVSQFKIVLRHIVPNVFHIVIITLVLDFSMLVLAEAVLSYVGVGVDPTTMSWGNMINSSRLELAREPVVWWPLLAALIAMFGLVLAANIFADAVRDAFDPYLRLEQ